MSQFIDDQSVIALGRGFQKLTYINRLMKQLGLTRRRALQKQFNSGGKQRPLRGLLNGKVVAQTEEHALLNLCFLENGFNGPIGIGIFTLVRCFSFGSANMQGPNMGAIPEKAR